MFKKSKMKAMVVTWFDFEDSGLDEKPQEIANLCFMAPKETVTSELKSNLTFDELQDAIYELIDELKKLSVKNEDLERRNQEQIKQKVKVLKDK